MNPPLQHLTELVPFHVIVTKILTKAPSGGRVYFRSQLEGVVHHRGKAPWQPCEAAAHTASNQEAERWMLVLGSLSPFHSSQDPRPWNGAAQLGGSSDFSYPNLETSSQHAQRFAS